MKNKKLDILLLTPPPNPHSYSIVEKFLKIGGLPPLGIGHVANEINELEALDINIEFIDAKAFFISQKKLLKYIQKTKPKIIGIQVLTPLYEEAKKLTKAIKKKFGDKIKIIWGGPHSTLNPDTALESGADYVVLGEAENVIKDLIIRIYNDKPVFIDGVYHKDHQKYILAPPVLDLDSINIDWNIYNIKAYKPYPHYYKNTPVTSFITSRGCPYGKCRFCFESKGLKTKYRRMSPQEVVKRIKQLVDKYGIKEISFWDENFIINSKWIKEFVKEKEKYLKDLTYTCYGKVDTVSREMLKMLGDSGCKIIQYGYESGVQEVLDAMNKGITLEQSYRATKWTKESGIEVKGSFIIGYINETPEMSLKTIQFSIDLDLDYAFFYPLHIYDGTLLYDEVMGNNQLKKRLITKGLEKGLFVAGFIPPGYKNIEELEKMIRLAYRRFYLRPAFIMKHVKKIKSLKDLYRYLYGAIIFLSLKYH